MPLGSNNSKVMQNRDPQNAKDVIYDVIIKMGRNVPGV